MVWMQIGRLWALGWWGQCILFLFPFVQFLQQMTNSGRSPEDCQVVCHQPGDIQGRGPWLLLYVVYPMYWLVAAEGGLVVCTHNEIQIIKNYGGCVRWIWASLRQQVGCLHIVMCRNLFLAAAFRNIWGDIHLFIRWSLLHCNAFYHLLCHKWKTLHIRKHSLIKTIYNT